MPRDVAGEDGTARRAGFDEADGEADRRLDRRDAAAGEHEEERTGKSALAQIALEILEIPPHQRLDIGVGTGGRETLVLPHLG